MQESPKYSDYNKTIVWMVSILPQISPPPIVSRHSVLVNRLKGTNYSLYHRKLHIHKFFFSFLVRSWSSFSPAFIFTLQFAVQQNPLDNKLFTSCFFLSKSHLLARIGRSVCILKSQRIWSYLPEQVLFYSYIIGVFG